MTYNTQDLMKEYCNYGANAFYDTKIKLGRALMLERINRGEKLEEVARKIQLDEGRIESIELGRCKIKWHYIGALLKYYNKEYLITLKDCEKKE